jgi:DNA-binding PadR family transcriptional regulator
MSQSGGMNMLEMTRALGLKKEQDDALRILKSDKVTQEFEAIVKLSGKWPNPFIIQVLPFQVNKNVSTEDLQTLMAHPLLEFRRNLIPRTEYRLIQDAKKREEQAKEEEKKKEKLEEAEEKEKVEGNILIQILTNIRDYPFIDQKTRIEMLGLASSSSTTDKYFKELVAKGFVNISKIGFGKEGSTRVLYEITPEGAKYAKMDSFNIPGKGDFKHKFWQHTIKTFYENQGYNAGIEKRFGLKNVDVGYETNGKKTGVEVELSSEHLIENLQKDFDAGCETVIVAVPNKRAINAYKKKILFYNKSFLDKVEFRVLTDFLP